MNHYLSIIFKVTSLCWFILRLPLWLCTLPLELWGPESQTSTQALPCPHAVCHHSHFLSMFILHLLPFIFITCLQIDFQHDEHKPLMCLNIMRMTMLYGSTISIEIPLSTNSDVRSNPDLTRAPVGGSRRNQYKQFCRPFSHPGLQTEEEEVRE